MGSWNTLHHFDDRKFYSEIVPDLKNDGQLLHKYFNSKFAKRILYRREDTINKEIAEIIKFSRFLDKDFKLHETLYEIKTREKNINESYTDFIEKRFQDERDFENANGEIIESINSLLTLIIFSECAAFNPHLILGRTIFTDCVMATPNSTAEEIMDNFTNNGLGSIFYSSYSNCNGLINWVTNEDLQLLWLDKENIYSADAETDNYFSDFCTFIEIALENNLGVISGTNMNESTLKLIPSPLNLKIDVKELGMEYVINYD